MWMTGHVVNVCVYLYLQNSVLGNEKEGRKEKEEEKVIFDNIS